MAEYQVGERFTAQRLVTQAQIDAYAEASGDRNPLHTDPAFAATTPLGGTVAHGMLVLAWLSGLMAEVVGPDWAARGSFRVRFRAPARPGDTLDLTVTVRDASSLAAAFEVLVTNQRGEAVIDGQAALRNAAPS